MPDTDKLPFNDLAGLPQSIQRALTMHGNFKDLGVSPLVRTLGLLDEQTNGHWCSRCEGIWFGYALEVQCPVCGNRSG